MLVKPLIFGMLASVAIGLGLPLPSWALPLSPGDRVRLLTPSDDELPNESRFRLSGLYEVNLDGTLKLPFLEPQPVVGLDVAQVERTIAQQLIQKGYFRPETFQLSVQVAQWAPVQVTVAGEAFYPGRVLINAAQDNPQTTALRPRERPEAISGEYPPERYLSTALRNAGGLRPTADIRSIKLVRGETETTIDLSGIVNGDTVADIPLIAGDRVIVPKLTAMQSELMRPSQVTPSEVPIMVSNLTSPNARGGQILKMEYGARFSQAVIAAGCAGGTRATNAKRRVVLIKTDRTGGQTAVVDRPVEALMRNSTNDAENPFLMPQDSVVCYDSRTTNLSGIARLVSDIFSPFFFIQELFRKND